MNIFYFSVHAILEDDEVRLFKSLGHDVFCLGINKRDSISQNYRPRIHFNEKEKFWFDEFDRQGGEFHFGQISKMVIPKTFIQNFDLVIVMHDYGFFGTFWRELEGKIVIWRTIGQGIENFDLSASPFRKCGLTIVRYSLSEQTFSAAIGQDATIRFCKSPDVYCSWQGDAKQVLSFVNGYPSRYPEEYSDYLEITEGLTRVLGGTNNGSLDGGIGMVEYDAQIALMQRSRAYLYASGPEVPYTLNFMEAWMTGTPMIVYAPFERRGAYFEIDNLIEDGVNGFVCRDLASTRECITRLYEDDDLARRISAAGRAKAIELFGLQTIGSQWTQFFGRLSELHRAQPLSTLEIPPKMSSSYEVLQALSLLKPYDIDVNKVRYGAERDGGYVLADIPSTADVLSFGVGPDVSFEYDMALTGRKVFLHDHTVDAVPTDHKNFTFKKIGVCGEGQKFENLRSLKDHIASIQEFSSGAILKMDIEGFEWEVFSTLSQDQLETFDQIAMEIHWLDQLSNPNYLKKFSTSLRAINRQFTLFHVHANNCAGVLFVGGNPVASVLEVSYVRTSLVRRSPSNTVYPTGLDKPNREDLPDHPLFFYPFLPSRVDDFRIGEVAERIG